MVNSGGQPQLAPAALLQYDIYQGLPPPWWCVGKEVLNQKIDARYYPTAVVMEDRLVVGR